MKSRVNKYQDLHEQIALDSESNIENSDLSHFANRLNQIDDQFDKMDVVAREDREPTHARQIEEVQEEHSVIEEAKTEPQFDTFESAYLKDFLDEVKEYNVRKGYRDLENTDANILSELNKSSEIAKPFNDDEMTTVLHAIDPELSTMDAEVFIEDEIEEEVNLDELPNLDETIVFKSVEQSNADTFDEEDELEKTIAMAVQEMVDDEDVSLDLSGQDAFDSVEFELDADEFENILSEEDDSIFEMQAQLDAMEDYSDNDFDSDKFRSELLAQTQTLQHKIIDQEQNIDQMNETMVRTNRMLNVVLSLLILAIIVVLLLIVAQFRK
ncbi:hypothetical protein PT197_03075 [Erysipelothrix rhusiopathiae]|uniref:hypothetical protein n=1 Tax=Erysipelothrix rhusiopathiae TaxID=1648 RepID=UPI000210B6D7|nr:hypothetical protein [Erysipelothrix rhusiopathiae]AGN24156.1 hypothetical protein K210_02655 [Erysipelothrix rhusiopathiae SY1027]AMS11061.1 hypothetical protein A2I91_04755 [Erysipelothrix rhusiopathiae]AOO67559.1 hypothetical protein BC346_04275 [Erysipelothrix rhusiopathiae]AWU41578.1 hypothetical protein DM789_04830 [Erysipelothrix rhusiopathiae]MCG4436186.1 hypothetical protein [Erysipelothrix rhusiopathiae]